LKSIQGGTAVVLAEMLLGGLEGLDLPIGKGNCCAGRRRIRRQSSDDCLDQRRQTHAGSGA